MNDPLPDDIKAHNAAAVDAQEPMIAESIPREEVEQPDATDLPDQRRFALGAPLLAAKQTSEVSHIQEHLEFGADLEINLCLSGGGFRAALFHLGVLYYLKTVGHLDKVRRISSVSGGSILAAHFALRRRDYLDHFIPVGTNNVRPALDFVAFAQSDLRGYVFRRWIAWFIFIIGLVIFVVTLAWRLHPILAIDPLGWVMICLTVALFILIFRRKLLHLTRYRSRVARLEQGFDRFLSHHLVDGASPTLNANLPNKSELDLEIVATSLTTSMQVSFSKSGITIHSKTPLKDKNPDFSVSRAVSASSAFPVAFPPVYLSKTEDLRLPASDMEFDHHVGDGGIYDNLGICNMAARLRAVSRHARKTILIVSDAGKPFQGDAPGKEQSYIFIPDRAGRAADIQMNRLALLDFNDAIAILKRDRPDLKTVNCQISETVANSDVSHFEAKICKIRTDLNSFNAAEIHVLVRHGFNVAAKMCQDHFGIAPEVDKYWSPISRDERRKLQLDDKDNPVLANAELDKALEESDQVKKEFIKNLSGFIAILIVLLPLLASGFIIIFCRPTLPDLLTLPNPLPARINEHTEFDMHFPDFREDISFLLKITHKPPAALCYFEIPISNRYKGRSISIAYKDISTSSTIKVYAYLKSRDSFLVLNVDSSDDEQTAKIDVPNCERGDSLDVFVVVHNPKTGTPQDVFAPFQIK